MMGPEKARGNRMASHFWILDKEENMKRGCRLLVLLTVMLAVCGLHPVQPASMVLPVPAVRVGMAE